MQTKGKRHGRSSIESFNELLGKKPGVYSIAPLQLDVYTGDEGHLNVLSSSWIDLFWWRFCQLDLNVKAKSKDNKMHFYGSFRINVFTFIYYMNRIEDLWEVLADSAR